jgi:biotin transport system substrate-specific component
VSKEISVPISRAAAPDPSAIHPLLLSSRLRSAGMRSAGIVIAGSSFAAVCAHVALPLPFTPVPLTLQPFAVLVLGLVLSPRLAAATLAAYLAEGAFGLPVFAPPMAGGLAHLLGPTGGYLLAYPVAAPLVSMLYRRLRRGFAAALVSAACGDLLILVSGAAWLSIFTHASLQLALTQALLPFLPGDALKVAAAAGFAAGFVRLRRRAN